MVSLKETEKRIDKAKKKIKNIEEEIDEDITIYITLEQPSDYGFENYEDINRRYRYKYMEDLITKEKMESDKKSVLYFLTVEGLDEDINEFEQILSDKLDKNQIISGFDRGSQDPVYTVIQVFE